MAAAAFLAIKLSPKQNADTAASVVLIAIFILAILFAERLGPRSAITLRYSYD